MNEMHMMSESLCSGSANWMIIASSIGLYGSLFFCAFHVLRMALKKLKGESFDYAGEIAHTTMCGAMTYMFLPSMSYHVIPDILMVFTFTWLCVGYLLRRAINPPKSAPALELMHAAMSAGMALMFLSSRWQSTVLNWLFLSFYSAYATVYGAGLFVTFSGPSAQTKLQRVEALTYGSSHIFMALCMIYMVLMPSMMPM